MSSLFKDIFPDSEIASGYASRKTKTTCIINGALRDHFHSRLIEVIKTRPYSLAVDGSNDTGLQKMNPLTVRVFMDGMVMVQLSNVAQLDLTMPHSNAFEERVFSMIRKNKTPFRPNLDPEQILGSIITTKLALPKNII